MLKALESAERAVQSCQKGGDFLQAAVQNYAQSVLDSTYFEETILVDQAFLHESSFAKIVGIINALSISSKLGITPQKVRSLLDDQLLECFYWRVGALLYMYCQTTLSRGATQKDRIMECCCAGVGHLSLMLQVQPPLPPLKEGEYTCNDPSLPGLLQQGIYSDVHMLALMYAGEMCYWHWELEHGGTCELVQGQSTAAVDGSGELGVTPPAGTEPNAGPAQRSESEPGSVGEIGAGGGSAPSGVFGLMGEMSGLDFVKKWRDEFDPVKLGTDCLSKYIDAARGPLKFQQWNYDRAIQLLIKLKSRP